MSAILSRNCLGNANHRISVISRHALSYWLSFNILLFWLNLWLLSILKWLHMIMHRILWNVVIMVWLRWHHYVARLLNYLRVVWDHLRLGCYRLNNIWVSILARPNNRLLILWSCSQVKWMTRRVKACKLIIWVRCPILDEWFGLVSRCSVSLLLRIRPILIAGHIN